MKKSDLWKTPPEIYTILDNEFHFSFDPCPVNPTFDGLKVEWGERNFVNPPYSETEEWVKKGFQEYYKGKTVVFLLRLDASTKWFRDYILPYAEIRLFEDRLWFVSPDGKQSRSDHASILAILNHSNKKANIEVIYWRKPFSSKLLGVKEKKK